MCRLVFYQFIYLAPHVVYQRIGILPPASSSKPQSPSTFHHLTHALGSCLRSPQVLIENMKARATPLTTCRVSTAGLQCVAFNCESAFIALLNSVCCEFCACGRYLLFGFAAASLHTACRMPSPSRMLCALLRISRKPFHYLDPSDQNNNLFDQTIAPTTANIELIDFSLDLITTPPGSRLLTHIIYPKCSESEGLHSNLVERSRW